MQRRTEMKSNLKLNIKTGNIFTRVIRRIKHMRIFRYRIVISFE